MVENKPIRPAGFRPKGIASSQIMVCVLGVIALSALVFSHFNSKNLAFVTANGLAQETTSNLSNFERAVVDSGLVAVNVATSESALPTGHKMAAHGQTTAAPTPDIALKPSEQNQHATAAGQRQASALVQAKAAREVDIMNTPMMIADHSDGSELDAVTKSAAKSDLAHSVIDTELQLTTETRPKYPNHRANHSSEPITALHFSSNIKPQTRTHSENNKPFVKDFSTETIRTSLKPHRLENRYSVMEGSIIPTITTRDIFPDLPGIITAMVNQNVYDSLTAKSLLICKGAKLVGQYSSQLTQGRLRIHFAFSKLILPNGQSFDLSESNKSTRSTALGNIDHEGDIKNHFSKIYGTSLVIAYLAQQVARPSTVLRGDIQSQASAMDEVLTETNKPILQHQQHVPSTITIPRGSLIHVEVRRDMVFDQPLKDSCQ